MRYSKLIYSDFASKTTDLNCTVRNIWIATFGLALIVINAFESDSGFSGKISLEGYMIFLTVGIYFALNLFSEDNKSVTNLFTIIVFLDLLSKLIFVFIAFEDIHYLFISVVSSAAYSTGMLTILFFQKSSDT